MFKSGFISVVGSPNAGKSTFINTVVGRKVSIVSNKVQTTRDMIRGVYNDDESQIVFLDTPGFHKPKNKLNVYMNRQIDEALMGVDAILYLVDAKYGIGRKEVENIEKLKEYKNIPKVVVINKIDKVDQEKVFKIISKLQEYDIFDDILAMSLKEKFNHESVIKVLKTKLKEEVKFYDDDQFSDYSDEFFAEEIIREKVLHLTKEEVPHSVGIKVHKMEEEQGILVIDADIYVERNSQKGIIIGRGGQMLKEIGQAARLELKKEFKQGIYLDLHVKVLSKWGQQVDKLQEVGYEIE